MTARRLSETIVTFGFASLFFFALPLFLPAKALPPETEGTGIACNPRQGVWSLYQPAVGQPYICGGERLVYWSELEPEEGRFNWEGLEWYLQNTQGEIFLAIPVTASEGRPCSDNPVLTGRECKGGQPRGQYRPATGRTCEGGCLPNWLEPKMCREIGLAENCWDSPDVGPKGAPTSRQKIIIEGMPIIWNKAYRYYFERMLAETGQWFNAHPEYKKRIGLIYASSGGGWGEMNLVSYGKTWRNRAWLDAGYTNKLFASEVYRTIEKYNDAFSDLPVSVQLGSGLFCYFGPREGHPDGNPPGCDHADEPGKTPTYYFLRGWPAFSANGNNYPAQTRGMVEKYGLKMNLRINGWGSVTTGGIHDQKDYCSFDCADPADPACSLATCSFESGRGPGKWTWLDSCDENKYFRPIAGSLDSSVSIQSVKWNEAAGLVEMTFGNQDPSDDCTLTTANALAYEARHIGAQILVKQPSLVVENGQLVFRALFYNRGNRPLFSTRLVGKKWVAASFEMEFDFYQGGVKKGTVKVEPSRPSYLWKPSTNGENRASARFLAPAELAAGEYQVKFALVDPRTDYRWNFFEAAGNIDMKEMVLGQITVGPGGVHVQPTQAPTQPPSGNECSCANDWGRNLKQGGDFDCSGRVDIGDFFAWTASYTYGNGQASLTCAQDFNPARDFNVWLTAYLNNQ